MTLIAITIPPKTTLHKEEVDAVTGTFHIKQFRATKEIKRPLTAILPSIERQFYDYSVIATGYCDCYQCTQNIKKKGITASGMRASRGTIAAPTSIPFFTKLNIVGLGEYIVLDRGGAIVELPDGTIKVDVWFPSHQQALNFGIQYFKAKKINN
jgi:3D (Asp-Asp-Asp) domain-containing protein